MINTPENHPSPHVIPYDNESIFFGTSLPVIEEAQPLPPSPTENPTTEHIDETLHNKSTEPLCTRTIYLLHHDVSNIPYVTQLPTPSSYKNIMQFELLNLHRILGC